MRTELIHLDREHPDREAIERAGRVIRRGGLCAFPTETVYGLGGDALNPEAARKIYAAKGRPSDNPLIVHIADPERLPAIAAVLPPAADKLMDAFWPGPLTIILPKKELVPDATSGGLPTVAVRMPADPVALQLIRASGGYIAAPSANASGRPSPTSAAHVMQDLSGRIEMVLDGGETEIGLESTIVDLTEEIPVVLRPGFINRDMLERVLGEVHLDPGLTDAGKDSGIRPKAPGMRYRHYAPSAPLYVIEGEEEAVIAKLKELALSAVRAGLRPGIIASDMTAPIYAGVLPEGKSLICAVGDRKEDRTIARNLFRTLREFDDGDVDVIYSEAFDTPQLGMAIMNRLLKAAGHQVIDAGGSFKHWEQ